MNTLNKKLPAHKVLRVARLLSPIRYQYQIQEPHVDLTC